MGKNKQAQRTKNNARPSNSSRSAELLGTALPSYIGFSAVKDGGYIPVLPGLSLCSLNEGELNSVDSNFQVILKKMNKKDSTTKYKALQEFATLCQDAELSIIENVLPFWPRLYCALAIDIEHKVREAAQLAHAAIAKRIGKGIVIYLKQLAGVWFISQYDTYPPAASSAINSFNNTFPPWKIIDAIVYLQREILVYIHDNITVHTAQTLSMQKSLTKEEREAKYQRVLISNLQGYSCYFKKVPLDEIDKTLDIHEKILNNSKFWKLATHDAVPIKIAFFNVLTSIMENAEKLLQSEKKKTLTTIVNNLDESEPGILSAVWESMLIATTKIDDWYLVINIDKFVLPKLWHILRSGGQCCASTVYPNLLPFISQFSKLSININDLYMNFFDNMRKGFLVKSVQMSRSETMAIAISFVECLRYSILTNVENIDLCIRLFKEQLIFFIEACIVGSISMKQFCFTEVAHLIRYWSKNRNNQEYKAYISLMQQFWVELRLLFTKLISREIVTSHTIDTKDSQIEFLLTLKNLPDRTRKKLKVNFSDSSSPIVSQSRVKVADIYTDEIFNVELCEFVNELCTIYFNNINNQQSIEYIKQLNKLIKHFTSRELFVALSKSFKFDKDFSKFYNNNLRALLLKNMGIMEQVIELIFYFIKYINDTEKNEVLKSLIKLNDIAITKNAIYCSLSENNKNDHVIKKWYTHISVTKLLIDVAKEIVSPGHNDLEKNQNLILLAFETSASGNLLINEDEANEIVTILCNSLNGTSDNCSIQFIIFITRLMTLIWSQKQIISSAVQILKTFFELCTREYDELTIDVVRNSWKEGLVKSNEILSDSEFNYLIKNCAIVIWNKIYNTYHVKDILVNLATDILEIIINNNNTNAHCINETVLLFLTASDIKLWIAEATIITIYGEIITGNLYISNIEKKIQIFEHYMSINITNDIISDNMTNCLLWALFTTDLLNNLYKRLRSSNTTNVNTSLDPKENLELYDLNLPGITEILINIIYVASIAEIYNKHYKTSKHYNDVNKLYNSLKSSFFNLKKYFGKNIHNDILSHIQKNQSNYRYMLPYIIRAYCAEFKMSDNPVEYYEKCKNNEEEHDEETYVQAIQILNDYWMPENIPLTNNDIHALIVTRIAICLKNDNSAYTTIVEKIMLYDKKDIALLDCNISNISWNQLCLLLEIIRLFTALVQKVPSKLQYEHWDFILISLTTWQQLFLNFELNYTDIKIMALMIAVNELYYAVQTLMNKHEQEPIPELPLALLDEWTNVFASCINSGIVKTWMFCTDLYNQDTISLKSIIPLNCLGKSISILDKNLLFKKYDKNSETNLINFDEMLKLSLELLQSPIPSIQLSAYHTLKHMVSELVQYDKVLIESDNFESNNFNIRKFEAILLSTQNIVNTMLMEFKLCDTTSCTIQPFTDSYTYTLEYLLVWIIVLEMCADAHSDLRYQYAEILKNDFFPCLLNNIFKLMPMEVLQDNKKKTTKLLEAFTIVPSFNFEESWTEWRLDHIVCWLYTNCLRHLPVLVRQWLSTADSKVSAIIDKITSHYISPILCQEELNNKLINVENMQIKVHPTTREVVALYQMDDTKLELSIVLPSNYPLGTVKVESDQHIGGTTNWRNCHMQLSIFLTHQNGSVWDGLIMWKHNLDKKFAGVEECYICFSIFHINTYQIPKLSCHTCRKKFHTLCLYKWFNTSHKSTCPICRNVF
ncbi:E3 ubiquitin-protein ligase listerin [Anoplolepis gracilipes]|uniref:E3 ubiquitin-protein ligase listerin n=1 Tax=Anoplolepis gracilipes TaxID=354296 RepID=UPI003B9F0853